jgi:hypothetical protein
MKKNLIILLITIIGIFAFSQDMRKTLLVYTKGYSEATGLLESELNRRISYLGKYKLVDKDDLLFRDILGNLNSNINQSNLKELNVDAIVFVDVTDSYQNSYIDKNNYLWWDFKLYVNYKLINVQNGDVLESKRFTGSGTSYTKLASTGFFTSSNSSYVMKQARDQAVGEVTGNIVSKLNMLFRIKADMNSNIVNDFVKINKGKNYGVYNGMIFQFVKEFDGKMITDGKLVVKQVRENEAVLRILEHPRAFNINNADYVIEAPYELAIRALFDISYLNKGLKDHGVSFAFAIDNYEGLYLGGNFEYNYNINYNMISIAFRLGYILDMNDFAITPNIGLGVVSKLYSEDFSDDSFAVTPGLKLDYFFNKNIGLTTEIGYDFNFGFNGNPIDNKLKLSAGLELRF